VRIAAIHGGDQRAGVEELLSETAVGPRAGGGAIGDGSVPPLTRRATGGGREKAQKRAGL